MQPPSPHDEILEDYLNMQRQRDQALDASSSTSLTPRERMTLLKLAYKAALDRAATLTIAGVALEDIDKNARICPITFNHDLRVDYYRLLEPSRVHDELLILWAKKMGLMSFDEQQQVAALNTLANVQPMEGMLRRFMDADDAVILPTTEVLQKMAPTLEQRLAKRILSGKTGWSLDTDFSKDPLLHCGAKIPILDDVTLSASSIPDSHNWAQAHDFIYIALRRPEEDSKKSGLLRPSVSSYWKDEATQVHFFDRFISTYPTVIGPELPTFPSFLSLAAAVGVYVFRVKAVRRIEGWEGFFVSHHDVAMYVAHLLCVASKASFRRALKLRPKNLPEKHADVKAFEGLPEDDDGDEVVTRGFPRRTAGGGGASKTVAKEGSNLSRDACPKKQKLAECNESEGSGSGSHSSRSRDSRQRLEPSLCSPIKLARLNLARAALRLDLALEELFDAGHISLLDLLLGWQAVNAAVGRDKARELVDLRLAKQDAEDALGMTVRVEEEEDEVRDRALLRAVSPATTCESSSRSSSPVERGSSGESWVCLTDD